MAEESGDSGNTETTETQEAQQTASEQNQQATSEQTQSQASASERSSATEQAETPTLADVQSENEGLRAILSALNPDMDINDELGYVGRGGKYRPAAAPAVKTENRQSRRAPLQNARENVDTDMTNEEIDKEFDQFMKGRYGFSYSDEAQA